MPTILRLATTGMQPIVRPRIMFATRRIVSVGATVTTVSKGGLERTVTIVGVDEVDTARTKICPNGNRYSASLRWKDFAC